jgi:DNA-binding GntR family transcriptional regulator
MSRVSGLAERVRLMVLRGDVRAGERMVELHLAEAFRVGRSTVREVLRQLAGDGLLVANESGGMRVVSLDADELAETLQVRAALEALSAGLAAGRVRDGDLDAGAVRALGRLADTADLLADRAFHRALDALAANRPAHHALARLWDRLLVAAPDLPVTAQAAREHHELLAAIAAGDEDEATALARRHVLATLA